MDNEPPKPTDRYTEEEITEALDWVATDDLTPKERAFLDATRAAYDKKLAQLKADKAAQE